MPVVGNDSQIARAEGNNLVEKKKSSSVNIALFPIAASTLSLSLYAHNTATNNLFSLSMHTLDWIYI